MQKFLEIISTKHWEEIQDKLDDYLIYVLETAIEETSEYYYQHGLEDSEA
jgi:hypothetical protein